MATGGTVVFVAAGEENTSLAQTAVRTDLVLAGPDALEEVARTHRPIAVLVDATAAEDVARLIPQTRAVMPEACLVALTADAGHSVDALRSGADDALVLPLEPTHLSSRLAWLLEQRAPTRHTWTLGARTVDLVRNVVVTADETAKLTANEARLFAFLARNPGETFTKDELLQRVWGYAPGVESRTVVSTMHRLRGKLEPDPSAPVFIVNVYGVGYRFDLPSDAPGGLPRPATSFVGRRDEVARIDALFGEGRRLVTLLGTAGAGKTRLSIEWAARSSDEWTFCDLTEAVDAEGIVRAVAAALHVPLKGDDVDEGVSQVAGVLANGKRLVLDNLDAVPGAPARDTVGKWLDAVPALQMLASSRARLGVSGEVVLEVEGLSAVDAEALFRHRALDVNSEVDLSDEAALTAVVDKLDRLPLAIELTVPRLRIVDLPTLRDRLTDGPSPIRAALDASWELMADWERAAFAQCAVFAGGFSLEAAERVLVIPESAPSSIDIIQVLRDRSLLRSWSTSEGLRLGLFESVRAYAREKLDDLGIRLQAEARHAGFYVHEAERWAARTTGPDSRSTQQRLVLERDNILAVFERARAIDPETALRALLTLAPVMETHGAFAEDLRYLERAVAAIEQATDETAARLLTSYGQLVRAAGDPAQARKHLEHAMTIAQDAQLEAIEVRARTQLARVCLWQSAHDEGAQLLEGGIAIARRIGDRGAEAGAWSILGIVHFDRSRLDKAGDAMRRAIALYEQVGDHWRRATLLGNLGMVLHGQGRDDEGQALLERGLELARGLGNAGQESTILSHLGNVALLAGRLEDAAGLYEDAIEVHKLTGDRAWRAVTTANLGLVHLDLGDLDRAEQDLQLALTMNREQQDRRFEGVTLHNLGVLRLHEQRLADGEALFHEALVAHREAAARIHEGDTLDALGLRWAFEGDVHRAMEWTQRSLDLCKEVGVKQGAATACAHLAVLLARLGQLHDAEARIAEAYEHLKHEQRGQVDEIRVCEEALGAERTVTEEREARNGALRLARKLVEAGLS